MHAGGDIHVQNKHTTGSFYDIHKRERIQFSWKGLPQTRLNHIMMQPSRPFGGLPVVLLSYEYMLKV